MNRLRGRIRPAGESSDEDEFADYMSVNNENNKGTLLKNTVVVNTQEREDERIFQLFLNGTLNEIVSLLDGGFDVNKRLRDDWTPLLLAASIGAPDTTAELLSRGADVNVHRDYYTPLMAAAACPKSTSPYESSLLVAQQLIKNNADVNAKTRKRITALMFAASNGNYAIVKELLPLCNKTAEDNQGWTALFWAVSGNDKEIVKLLLEEGLPYNKLDVRGNLPIHYAKENDCTDIIDILPLLQEEEKTYVFNEYGYEDFFNEGRSEFIQDVVTMLYGMKNEKNIEQFLNNNIDLFKFLTINEEDLKSIEIKMPYDRQRILNGLYRFHKYPFKTKALPIVGKNEPYSTLNVANTVLSACRQFIVMQASLRYILKNTTNLHELNDCNKEIQQIKHCLSKIKHVVIKINEQALEWDRQTKPADLITKESCKKLKSSKLKYFYAVNILSIVAYVTWKKIR